MVEPIKGKYEEFPYFLKLSYSKPCNGRQNPIDQLKTNNIAFGMKEPYDRKRERNLHVWFSVIQVDGEALPFKFNEKMLLHI